MQFNVPLARWIPAVISFVAGSIVPVIYSKLSYEGVSIKQPYELRAFVQNKEQKNRSEIIFSTILKFANATKSSVLIDEVNLNPSSINGIEFAIQKVSFKEFTPGEQYSFHVPLADEKGVALNYLPFIVKSNEERALVIEFIISYSKEKRASAFEVLSQHAEANGLLINIRVNGKFRNYVLNVKEK